MAIKLGWDFWTSQAQPPDFIDELIIYLNTTAAPSAKEETADWLAATRAKHAGMIKRYFA